MRLRLYLDTSVISAHVDDRLPERRRATLEFWERLAGYEVAISELTLTEVRATADSALRERLLALVGDFLSLPIEREARDLAREYVGRGVFSAATAIDALHVAIAVAARQDILVSWSFRHLVNRRRRALVNEVNVLAGYPSIEILAPPEV
ncbi:MAG: PIN domain-containing protein [Candidatus Rokubacteria bacterium]|nr:PIN domain-containing protein [Candidatus Rokubacteria bacterium]